MAEVAAGALVAEQIVATGVEVGAAVAVAAPTQPLKVSLTQLAMATSEDTKRDLARTNHTITTVGNKAYMFGGEDVDGKLCNSDVHAILLPSKDNTGTETLHDHYPAFPLIDAQTSETYIPAPRTRHAACAWGNSVVIHGGCDEHRNPIEEDNCLWVWDTEHMKWTRLNGETQLGVKLAPRYGHHLFVDDKQKFLVLHGGHTSADSSSSSGAETETWLYSFDRNAWTTLPSSPSPPLAAAYTDNILYTISASPSFPNLSGVINYLDLLKSTADREKPGALMWQSITYPINPLTPGPKPRIGGALVPIHTGYGRSYLIYMFGVSSDATAIDWDRAELFADIWSLQLPSQGFTVAAAKDVIRDKLMPKGVESGKFSWAEAELIPTEKSMEYESEGKVHPGPRALLAASGCLNGKGVVLWGGVNAKREKEADGWVLGLAFGYADNDRFE